MTFLLNYRNTALIAILLLLRVPVASSHNQDQQPSLQLLKASVVAVSGTDTNGKAIVSGSGFFVGDDLIATDYRLIKDAVKIEVKPQGGDSMEAVVTGVDIRRAVAVLKVRGAKGQKLPPAEIADAKAGETVYYIFKDGVKTTIKDIQASEGKRYFQLSNSAPLESRGAPLLNSRGEVIGILTSGPADASSVSQAAPASYLGTLMVGYGILPDGPGQAPPIKNESVPGGVPGKDAPASPNVIQKTGAVVSGTALRRAEPLYPPLARAARVGGTVVVEVTVDEEGDVVSERVVTGHPLLKDASLNASRGWKFGPTKFEGKPVKVIGTVTFNFAP